jgi:thiamine-monophosphate kinase
MASDRPDSEEAIIGAFFAPLAKGFPGAFDLRDDCAAITPEPGFDLVVTTDAVIAGVHFFPGEGANAIAWKALAVNVSDLVAKGATPLAYLMTLALPEAPERVWLAAFAKGLELAQETFNCHLIGGDTDRTPGPLSVSIGIRVGPTGGWCAAPQRGRATPSASRASAARRSTLPCGATWAIARCSPTTPRSRLAAGSHAVAAGSAGLS